MAKFDVKAIETKKKKAIVRPQKTPRIIEQDIEKFLLYMAKTMKTRFINKTLKELNKSTIEKFTDAQVGNYSVIFKRLAKKFEKSINSQFSEDRIRKFIQKKYKQTSRMNDKKFYESLHKSIGVDVKDIIKTDGTNSFVNAKALETIGQIIKFKNESIFNYTQNVIRLMSAGKSLDTLYEEVENISGKNDYKSKLVARNELKTFNQQLSDKKALNSGVTKAIWRTVGDERTRPCHKQRDGIKYDIEKGLYHSCDGKTLKAGEEINCRCYAEYVVEFD